MKVLVVLYGDVKVASSRTRFLQLLPYILKAGEHDFKILSLYANRRWKFLRYLFLVFLILWNLGTCDVVFIQKIVFPTFFIRFIAKSKKIIFDFDDAVHVPSPSSSWFKKKIVKLFLLDNFRNNLKYYSLVVLEHDIAAEVVKPYTNSITKVLGPIETNLYKKSSANKSRKITIGWVGSPMNSIYIRPIVDVLNQLVDDSKAEVMIIGASKNDIPGLKAKFYSWQLEDELKQLAKFDIGIMPLDDTSWTQGKGGYKLLQYMSMGIPSVASPVGINKYLIEKSGSCFSANTQDEWQKAISCLIEDPSLRLKMGNLGRKFVKKNHSTEKWAKEFSLIISNINDY